MKEINDPKIMAQYIGCLGKLEELVSLLYNNLSDGVEIPLIKSILLSISQDSQKHATLLDAIANSMSDSQKKFGNCEKNLEVWRLVKTYLSETGNPGKAKPNFNGLFPKLVS